MFNSLKLVNWNPKTILDIGGYKGTWTKDAQIEYPYASFTIIEPNHHVELNNVQSKIYYELLSSEVKEVVWYSNLSTGDSMYKENTKHYTNISGTNRNTTTLDILFPYEQFDLIKIDCQGAELDILRGGETMLKNTEVVLLECSFACEYNKGAPTFVDYITYMNSIGFSVLDITELHKANNILIQVDILFLRKTSQLWSRFQDLITK
jgi:FkbM family methyltransferase